MVEDLTQTEIDAARPLVLEKPSTSYLQRKLLIPYSHAMRLMDFFEFEGLVTERNSAGRREITPAGRALLASSGKTGE